MIYSFLKLFNIALYANYIFKEVIMSNILDKVKKLHFVGIGGSGMCPMAEILFNAGYIVKGSDQNESNSTQRLKSLGIEVIIGHSPDNVKDAELIVYTAAAKDDNPELVKARVSGIPTLERSVVLGKLMSKYSKAIGVSGTHGKTTTTAMITQTLMVANEDPSAIIGGMLPYIGSNAVSGKSEYMVCEACEYVDTFLQLYPSVSVILNLEEDHLDYFKNLENIISSFNKFAIQTKDMVIVNGDDIEALKSTRGITAKVISFGINKNNDYYPELIESDNKVYKQFYLMYKGEQLCKVELSVPGEHNLQNALACCATCASLGIDPQIIAKALNMFTGVHRRFEVLGKFDGVTLADDFAHHPTELKAVLGSAKRMNFGTVWAIFQPHTFSRTHAFLNDFAQALSITDKLILTDILAVREENVYGISADDLGNKIDGTIRLTDFIEIADFILANAKEGDLVITLGGGDIYKCANIIHEKYTQKMMQDLSCT